MESVCQISDLQDNCPKEVTIDGHKILLVRQQESVYAIGTKCSHYGMPLSKGVVYQNKIRCPFHGACFSLKTGDIEDFPGIESIPCYRVAVEGSTVKVSTDDIKGTSFQSKASGERHSCSSGSSVSGKTVVVVGGGIASFQFAYTLREHGFSGSVMLLTDEDSLPYDRTKLSKAMSSTASDLQLKPSSFYENLDIQVLKGTRITRVDPDKKVVESKDGHEFPYDSLFIASGLKPRIMRVPGSCLANIFYVRSYKDANRVSEASAGKEVVILGSSFIAMEAAAFLKNKASSVTVVARSSVPFASILGDEVGKRIKALFESKGISFHMNSQVHHFEGEDEGQGIKNIHLNTGQVLSAQVCVVGLGTEADLEYLQGSGIDLDSKGHVIVDSCMKTSRDNIYAGGDMVSFPLEDKRLTIGHWQMAQSHGKVAALNMLGKDTHLKSIPFFWSMFFGKGLRYAGHTDNVSEPVISGDLDNFKFVAYYFSEGKVAAVASIGQDEVPSIFASLVKDGHSLREEDIRRDPNQWLLAFKDGPQVTRI